MGKILLLLLLSMFVCGEGEAHWRVLTVIIQWYLAADIAGQGHHHSCGIFGLCKWIDFVLANSKAPTYQPSHPVKLVVVCCCVLFLGSTEDQALAAILPPTKTHTNTLGMHMHILNYDYCYFRLWMAHLMCSNNPLLLPLPLLHSPFPCLARYVVINFALWWQQKMTSGPLKYRAESSVDSQLSTVDCRPSSVVHYRYPISHYPVNSSCCIMTPFFLSVRFLYPFNVIDVRHFVWLFTELYCT